MAASLQERLGRWMGDGWYGDLCQFRHNPSLYLTNNRLTPETLTDDIIQAVASDSFGETVRIHCLSLLQEYADVLLSDLNRVEGTLQLLLNQLHRMTEGTSSVLKGHVFITVTSLAILYDIKNTGKSTFQRLVEALLDIVCKTSVQPDKQTRSTACECLLELETTYPGLLCKKLEYIYQLCQLEQSSISQHYHALLTTIVHNLVHSLAQHQSDSVKDNLLTDLLSNRQEPLKPFIVPEKTREYSQQTEEGAKKLLSNVDTKELRRAISFLVNNLNSMTTARMLHVSSLLLHIVSKTQDISCSTFKILVYRLCASLNPACLHLIVQMKHLYGEELLGGEEERQLVWRILQCFNNPALPHEQRLLYFEWLKHWNSKPTPGPCNAVNFPSKFGAFCVRPLLPTTFDSIDVQLKKLELLSSVLTTRTHTETSAAILMGCLVTLHKPVQYGVGGAVAVAMFQALYYYYTRSNLQPVHDDIKRLVMDMMTSQPKFTSHVMDFLDSIHNVSQDSKFRDEVLSAMLDSLSTSIDLQELETAQVLEHLRLVQKAASQPDLPPHNVLGVVRKLLHTLSLCTEGSWNTGNAVLNVCKSLLQHHNTDTVFQELGCVLYQVMTSFENIDIRDRAAFYYGMLCNLSSDKVNNLLESPTQASSDSQNLANMVTAGNSFPSAPPINVMSQSVLELTRIHKVLFPSENMLTGTEKDILDQYVNVRKTEAAKQVMIPFTLDFNNNINSEDFDEVFAIVLHFSTDEHVRPVKDISISHLKQGREHNVEVKFAVLKPLPAKVETSVTFTGADMRTYSCYPAEWELSFEDFFHPLPTVVSSDGDGKTCNNLTLFNMMWSKFASKSDEYCESVYKLNIRLEDICEVLRTRWKAFAIQNEDGDDEAMGVYLPPGCHVLMRFSNSNDCALVHIATDSRQLLPLLSSLLSNLTPCNEDTDS